MTLAATGNTKFVVWLPSAPAFVIAGGIGLVFVFIAWKLPEK